MDWRNEKKLKTCEEYILKKFLESEEVIKSKEQKIDELNAKIFELENPKAEYEEQEDKKLECITLYKTPNVIYKLSINTFYSDYKKAFESRYANGKITIDDLKEALTSDKKLDELNLTTVITRYGNERMYEVEAVSHNMFEFTIDKTQYLIWGNPSNLALSTINDLDRSDCFFYEKFKDEVLKKARKKAREVLQDVIEYLEKQEAENET